MIVSGIKRQKLADEELRIKKSYKQGKDAFVYSLTFVSQGWSESYDFRFLGLSQLGIPHIRQSGQGVAENAQTLANIGHMLSTTAESDGFLCSTSGTTFRVKSKNTSLTARYLLSCFSNEKREELLGAANSPCWNCGCHLVQLFYEFWGLWSFRINRLWHQWCDPKYRESMQGHLRGNYSSRHHILPCDDFLVPLKKHIPPRLLGSDILRHLLLEIKSSGCKILAIMVRTRFSGFCWLSRETAKFGIYFVLACMYTIQVLNYIWFTAFIKVIKSKFIDKKGYVVQMEGELSSQKVKEK